MPNTLTLDAFNHLPPPAATAALSRCCGARRWVEQMVGRRPFGTYDDLLSAADESFANLTREDWLEAFSHHPKIGDLDSLRARFARTADWAAGEQSGASDASDATLRALAEENETYQRRFGYIFIVCATGKSAEQMRELLGRRLANDPEAELETAAAEQMKITHLRLRKLIP
ncbi:MAG TPA: 2-oxo-4-hydroxy-4-carboxy-5-ureidoimidazoline decarboxylase [Tepidisphaeraceae bacterium]|jgi:2-oxo-4-hydroxy-4-carboxy-5-ureidoimidazoline decarboxylase